MMASLALAIAEAQVDVRRIRMFRHVLIAGALKRFGAVEPAMVVKALGLIEEAKGAVMNDQA